MFVLIGSSREICKRFEKFARYNSRKFELLSSGTAALEVAIKALNLKKFRSYNSFFNYRYCLCVIKCGLKPILLIVRYTWNMDPV